MLERANSVVRFDISFRPLGSKEPSIRKLANLERSFRITLKACVDHGAHELRFVLKDELQGKWIANNSVTVDSSRWRDFHGNLRAPSSSDLFFRIDDRAVTSS